MRCPLQSNGEPKFEWHIEARSRRSLSIKLHPRKVVNGISRLANE